MPDRYQPQLSPEQEQDIKRLKAAEAKLDAFIQSRPEHHLTQFGGHGEEFRSLISNIKSSINLSVQRVAIETEAQKYHHISPESAEKIVDHFIELYNLLVEGI